MRPKPPEPPPPNPANLIAGVIAALLGLGHEALSRPIQPITYVPGLAFVPLGLGVALALVERKYPIPARIAYYFFLVGILYMQVVNATSLLPACLFAAGVFLARYVAAFQED